MSSITLHFLVEPSTVNFGGKVHGGTVMINAGAPSRMTPNTIMINTESSANIRLQCE